jgi:hypothetical protein
MGTSASGPNPIFAFVGIFVKLFASELNYCITT